MKNKHYSSLLKYLPLILCIILIVCYLGFSEDITVQTILDYTPVSGTDAINKLLKKYPAFDIIVQKQNSNSSFMCFFLRTLFILPGDAVSIYLGAVKTPFGHYLIASTLGSLPSTILATLFGASITEPTSPMFWISILLMTLYAGCSLLVYHVYRQKKQKDDT